ncbi:hypothetical protein DDE18_22300 [Nocardioides gansuensis]|uniref:DUF306 domain-containing protein n=2 Tax=Nocardioides gansuensis TaxID=2138300 RepID=A0A2T8F4F2_9ACTN|nr:hypothetical protein DDE18_22300 [Nocardioides gansuensis]
MRLRFVVLVAAALLIVTGCSESDPSTDADAGADGPPTTTASEEVTSDPPEPSRKDREDDLELRGDWEELGPDGFLELRLGMSQAEALATRRIAIGETVGRCTGFYLAMYGDAQPGPHGYFTTGRGLSVIRAQGQMHTANGVKHGTRHSKVLDSFADLVGSESFMTARASDRAEYYFVFNEGVVSDFGLASAGDPCLVRALRR